ncbi:MAG: hypothetical protein SF066_22480 [Thermoanaerobaculia bacterium]|nr:hypothetical protein [Thermoanaerobaculia bacterium]
MIGLLREPEDRRDRRVLLAPFHVEELVQRFGRRVVVEPSAERIFEDAAYQAAGARVAVELADCRLLLGLAPPGDQWPVAGQTLLCFLGASSRRPESQALVERAAVRGATLIDLEAVVDRFGQRPVTAGRWAGAAGMIEALRALGERLSAEGWASPLAALRPAASYGSLGAACAHLEGEISAALRSADGPAELHPIVFGIAGGGPLARGAEEILAHLPGVEMSPDDLPELGDHPGLSRRAFVRVSLRRYQRVRFVRHLPHLTVLVNALRWEAGEPRLVLDDDLGELFAGDTTPKLRLIADLPAQVRGAVEPTRRLGHLDDPRIEIDPRTGAEQPGGFPLLAAPAWASAFAQEASLALGDALFPFLAELATEDFAGPLERLPLPAALLGGVVVQRGELTARWRYLERG